MASSLAEPSIRPTTAALGADVEGVDLVSSGDADIAILERALRERLVIRLRGYVLDDVEFTRLAERFGDLEGSPDFSKSREVYVAASPKMTVVSNVTVDGKPIGDHGDGELNWHTDQGFVDRPSGFTFLLAREVPPTRARPAWLACRSLSALGGSDRPWPPPQVQRTVVFGS